MQNAAATPDWIPARAALGRNDGFGEAIKPMQMNSVFSSTLAFLVSLAV